MANTKFDRIFIIDDESIINSIQKLFIQEFFPENSLERYDDSSLALDKLTSMDQEVKEVLIFVDLNMPILSGQQLLDKLQESGIHYNVTVYVLTFSSDAEEVEKIRSHPYVRKVIRKPLTKDKLAELDIVRSKGT
ncbi:response regulator [uncultured Christiangramia sp.]|uniref:response regulator n=1 Tax=uncultured Christiangramia sp. TaxID=503836 RepID=UPI002603C7E6|nr:response regulator [uncultured Christiangramia sp.]